MSDEKKEWRDGVFLTTVDDSMEALILESKLKSEGIPVQMKYKGAGNFLEIALGTNSTYPIELYVPEETIEDARNIIVPIPLTDDFDVDNELELNSDEITDGNVEIKSESDANADSGSYTDAESKSDRDAESKSCANAESWSDADAESENDADARCNG